MSQEVQIQRRSINQDPAQPKGSQGLDYSHPYNPIQQSMRYLRTDDINGAQPKNWGMGINRGKIAGNPSGDVRTYKNESHVFNHVYEAGNINSHFTKHPGAKRVDNSSERVPSKSPQQPNNQTTNNPYSSRSAITDQPNYHYNSSSLQKNGSLQNIANPQYFSNYMRNYNEEQQL